MPTDGRKSSAQRRSTRTKPRRRTSARAHDDSADTRPDPVNLILAQWQRERPDLDPAPMRLFGVLARAHLLTTPYMNVILADHGLARGTFDVLSALRRAGPPFSLTPKQLSQSLMLSAAGMTSRLARLEGLRLVARLPEPNDRRSLKIQLTQRGVRMIDDVIPQIIAAQWRVVSRLGARKTKTLIDLLADAAEALTIAGNGAADD